MYSIFDFFVALCWYSDLPLRLFLVSGTEEAKIEDEPKHVQAK